jgi:hypothetical protein
MAVPFSGGCRCGAVRYECTAEPAGVAFCFCRDCQIASGADSSCIVLVPRDALAITRGELGTFAVRGDSGKRVTRKFCRECGTPLFSELEVKPDLAVVRAASLDDPSWLEPSMVFWASSAQPWARIPEGLTRFDRNPPL